MIAAIKGEDSSVGVPNTKVPSSLDREGALEIWGDVLGDPLRLSSRAGSVRRYGGAGLNGVRNSVRGVCVCEVPTSGETTLSTLD